MERQQHLRFPVIIALILFLCPPASGQQVEYDVAFRVATNWVTFVERAHGGWADDESAEVTDVQPLFHSGSIVGYVGSVSPNGYVVVPVRREFAPIKAYSERSTFYRMSPGPIENLVILSFERGIKALDRNQTAESTLEGTTKSSRLAAHEEAWEFLDRSASEFQDALVTQPEVMTTERVGPLLTSTWGQSSPFNAHCPYQNCSTTANGKAVTGCVATAAAQIMRYWDWPPYGEENPYTDTYDWTAMPDSYEPTSPWSSREINAVGELMAEVGDAAATSYGCSESSATMCWNPLGRDMLEAYQGSFSYHDDADCERRDWNDDSWFAKIQDDINRGRPLQYRIQTDLTGGHSMVCDGWEQSGSMKKIHLNYGWPGYAVQALDTFWELDDIPESELESAEIMIRNIHPEVSLGTTLEGNYELRNFPYRYFDRRTMSSSYSTFDPGQMLQFRHGVTARTAVGGGVVVFEGSISQPTFLFTNGDPGRGSIIRGGSIVLKNGGGIRLK